MINSWHIFMLFFGCALCCPLIDTINFQRMKGIKVVHIPGKFCWYRICSSWVKFSNVFAAANCHFRLLLGDFLARTPQNVLNFVWKFEQWWHARWCIRYAYVVIEVLRNGPNRATNWHSGSSWEFFCLRLLTPYELHPKIFPSERHY